MPTLTSGGSCLCEWTLLEPSCSLPLSLAVRNCSGFLSATSQLTPDGGDVRTGCLGGDKEREACQVILKALLMRPKFRPWQPEGPLTLFMVEPS